jgi:hypothetical protein
MLTLSGRCAGVAAQCMSTASEPQKCFAKREDYMECLHHRKEVRGGPHPRAASPSS